MTLLVSSGPVLDQAPGFNFEAPRTIRASEVVKACFDGVLAAVGLVVLLPVLVAISIVVSLDGGPILYAHPRIGRNGRTFQCLKFRSMAVNGDELLADVLARDQDAALEWAATRKLKHDIRVTKVGRFLRASSLDELPQLINILRQDMSLVGPRPIVRQEVSKYSDKISLYYGTRPGLTGLWQISGRSNTSYDERVELDAWYAQNRSFWLDIGILLKTIPAVLRQSGAH